MCVTTKAFKTDEIWRIEEVDGEEMEVGYVLSGQVKEGYECISTPNGSITEDFNPEFETHYVTCAETGEDLTEKLNQSDIDALEAEISDYQTFELD